MKLLSLLKEYSEGAINRTIERWQEQKPDLDIDIAKKVIQRFDQIKQGLNSKLDQVSLSDELRGGNKYLNIDHYSIDDMINLLRSLPEKDSKIKKEAIKKFMQEATIDQGMATHYVIRFLNARKALKYAIDNGTEDGQFSSQEVKKFIPSRLIATQQELDPRAWKFQNMEHMLDALFPFQGKVDDSDDGQNTATIDADKIYDKDGLEVYKGDAQHKCVAYNPNKDGKKKYGWCISQPGNSNYDYYRFQQGTNRMFYIVFDRNQNEDNKYHAFVIHVGENGKYWVTNAKNDGDNSSNTWEGLSQYIDPNTWNRIRDLKNKFPYIPPSKSEIQSAALRGKKLSANDFRELDYDTKKQYIQSNAGKLTKEILSVLDKELKTLAINYGQKFPFNELKGTTSLAKRYAIFRFRHTNYSDEPIPLPYVQFLDDSAKAKYLETFDDSLNYDYIKQYFGDSTLKKYIDKNTEKLDYIQPDYIKYIQDKQLKQFYQLYNKLTQNWSTNSDFNKSEEELGESFDMPNQEIDPKPIWVDDFKSLSTGELTTIINTAVKFKGEKYSTLTFALPTIIKNGGDYLFLIPQNEDSTEWILFDSKGTPKQKVDGDSSLIDGEELVTFYPHYDRYDKIFDMSSDNIKLNSKSLNENKTKERFMVNITLGHDKDTLMNRAGLL